MQKTVILFCLISVLLGLGCEEPTAPKAQPQASPIVGEWEWVSTRQSWGYTLTPATAGYRRTDRYSADSVLSIYRNDTLVTQRKYMLVEDSLGDSEGNTADILLIESGLRDDWTAWMAMYPTSDTLLLFYMGLHGDDVTFKKVSPTR